MSLIKVSYRVVIAAFDLHEAMLGTGIPVVSQHGKNNIGRASPTTMYFKPSWAL
jgi:hypothetical protein